MSRQRDGASPPQREGPALAVLPPAVAHDDLGEELALLELIRGSRWA